MESNIALTPRHFLTLNPDIRVPNLDYDMHDPDYEPFESSTSKLLRIWKQGQYLLDAFWKSWKNEYLLSLRERTRTQLKVWENFIIDMCQYWRYSYSIRRNPAGIMEIG